MNRPDWFNCGNCLWWDEDDEHSEYRVCVHSDNDNLEVRRESYCNKWTCSNCWGGWEEYFFPIAADKEDSIFEDEQFYIDHKQCETVQFANRKEKQCST